MTFLLRYLFANGSYGAIEFERVGIMTDFEYNEEKTELYAEKRVGRR